MGPGILARQFLWDAKKERQNRTPFSLLLSPNEGEGVSSCESRLRSPQRSGHNRATQKLMPVTIHVETPLQLHCVTFGGTLHNALPVKHGERTCRISTSAAGLVASLAFVTDI